MRTVLCSMRTVSCRCTRTCSSNSRRYIAITMTLAQVSKAKVRQVGGTFSRTPTPPEHKGNFLLCGVWYPCLSGISRSLSLELHGSVVLPFGAPRMGAQGVTLAVHGSTCESRVRLSQLILLRVGSAGRARLLDEPFGIARALG